MKVSGNEEGVSLADGIADFLHVLVGRDVSVVHLAPPVIEGADLPPRDGWCARTMCGLVWGQAAGVLDEAVFAVHHTGAVCACCAQVAVSDTTRHSAVRS